ncbi:MAG TPA: maleylpyruvate isomerase N-terminal domain-containing protein [Acidimicrobiales bacterium]|nr:maleylpyruvate isomerase N-terminal domain-containing protein [Acidimicrobiales bacterium]
MQAPALSREEVDAYLGAVDWLRSILLRSEVAASWGEPGALLHYSVGGVAAHAVHGVVWLEQVLKDAEPLGLRSVAVGEFFGLNRVEGVDDDDPFAASLRSAAESFAQTGAPLVAAACTAARDELVGLLVAASAARAVPVIRVAGGQVPLSEYLRTRILEVVVHGDDVVSSVPGLHVPDPPPAAMGVSLEVCLELARARVGDLASLRAFTRTERALPDALRVL